MMCKCRPIARISSGWSGMACIAAFGAPYSLKTASYNKQHKRDSSVLHATTIKHETMRAGSVSGLGFGQDMSALQCLYPGRLENSVGYVRERVGTGGCSTPQIRPCQSTNDSLLRHQVTTAGTPTIRVPKTR
jgi:hypothetical protein